MDSEVPETGNCERCGCEVTAEEWFFGMHLPRYCSGCVEAIDRANAEKEKSQRKAQIERAWGAVCPAIFRDTDTSHPAFPTDIYNDLQGWGPDSHSLFLYGPTRAGKSRVFWLLLEDVFFRHPNGVRIFRSGELETMVYQAFREGRYDIEMRELIHVPILALDDWAKEKFTERFESFCFHLFNARWEDRRPIIITSNATSASLQERLNEPAPMLARIREFCRLVNFANPHKK